LALLVLYESLGDAVVTVIFDGMDEVIQTLPPLTASFLTTVFLPNCCTCVDYHIVFDGGMMFFPSKFSQSIIGNTHVVRRKRKDDGEVVTVNAFICNRLTGKQK